VRGINGIDIGRHGRSRYRIEPCERVDALQRDDGATAVDRLYGDTNDPIDQHKLAAERLDGVEGLQTHLPKDEHCRSIDARLHAARRPEPQPGSDRSGRS